jgi:hypothetical protein
LHIYTRHDHSLEQTQCIMPPMFPCVHRIFAERFI